MMADQMAWQHTAFTERCVRLLRGSSLGLQGCTHRLQSGAFCRLQPKQSAKLIPCWASRTSRSSSPHEI